MRIEYLILIRLYRMVEQYKLSPALFFLFLSVNDAHSCTEIIHRTPIIKFTFYIINKLTFQYHVIVYIPELPWSISDQVDKLDNRYVLATNSFSKDVIGQYNFYVSDIISPKIPMSLEFRCLHYSHLVLGDNALVVAYITDYFEPYEISHYLKTHGDSSFINFSRTSVTLPIGTDFKVKIYLVSLVTLKYSFFSLRILIIVNDEKNIIVVS